MTDYPFLKTWVFLIFLTLTSYFFAEEGTQTMIGVAILALGVVKLLTVLWSFMEAWHAHLFWKLGLPAVVVSVVSYWSFLILGS